MIVTEQEIRKVVERLIKGEISREDADRWAFSCIEAFDVGGLEFLPKSKEEKIWSSIRYLHGVDTQISQGVYMHSIEDIKLEMDSLWGMV